MVSVKVGLVQMLELRSRISEIHEQELSPIY